MKATTRDDRGNAKIESVDTRAGQANIVMRSALRDTAACVDRNDSRLNRA